VTWLIGDPRHAGPLPPGVPPKPGGRRQLATLPPKHHACTLHQADQTTKLRTSDARALALAQRSVGAGRVELAGDALASVDPLNAKNLAAARLAVHPHLTECINEMVLDSQLPHEIVNL